MQYYIVFNTISYRFRKIPYKYYIVFLEVGYLRRQLQINMAIKCKEDIVKFLLHTTGMMGANWCRPWCWECRIIILFLYYFVLYHLMALRTGANIICSNKNQIMKKKMQFWLKEQITQKWQFIDSLSTHPLWKVWCSLLTAKQHRNILLSNWSRWRLVLKHKK